VEVGVRQEQAARVGSCSEDFDILIAAARKDNTQALGTLLEAFQPALLRIADQVKPNMLRGKCDGADLVQETLLEAHRGFARFHGQSANDLRLWLQGILLHNLLDLVRRYCKTCKRSLGRERSLDAYLESVGPVDEPIDPNQTPCDCAMAREDLAALRAALERLPTDEQLVIELRNLDHLSFHEIGRQLRRSPEAARKLWSRAIARLERLLALKRDLDC
jgi:RNA polymerase sigma-70 factor (ECF subfamily)